MAKALPVFAVDPRGSLAENAPLILHIRLEEMFGFATYIADVNRVAELHNMRIAAKRLRYTMELFAVCFPSRDFDPLYEAVKSIQEQIGDIHDCDVRRPLAEEFLKSHGAKLPEIRVGLARLVEHETERRQQLYDSFIAYWKAQTERDFKRKFLQLLAAAGQPERGK